MTGTLAAEKSDVTSIAASSRRSRVGTRRVPVLAQSAAVLVVGVAAREEIPTVPVFAATQVLVLVSVFLLPLLVGRDHPLLRRARRFALRGVVITVAVVPVLVLLGLDIPAAHLVALVTVVVICAVGRFLESFHDAGRQIDAVLATLPPDTRADPQDLAAR